MKTKIVAPKVTVKCAPPVNYTATDQRLFQDAFENRLSESTLKSMTNVEAFGRGPLHHNGKLLKEFFALDEHSDEWYRRRKHWRLSIERLVQRSSLVDTPVIWISDNWSCGYFHWICDALMRLEAASTELDLSEITLLLPYKYQFETYLLPSLAAFPLAKVRFLKRFERAVCSQFWFPSQVSRTGNFKRPITQALRQRFVEHTQSMSSRQSDFQAVQHYGDKIYISRRQAGRRRVANEADFTADLESRGFKVFVAEQHDWLTQMRVFTNARYVVANHGAGLTNCLMMNPGTHVLEIRDREDWTPNCYYRLASACDLNYYYSLADRAKPQSTVHFGDVIVDRNELLSAVDAMFQNVSDQTTNVTLHRYRYAS